MFSKNTKTSAANNAKDAKYVFFINMNKFAFFALFAAKAALAKNTLYVLCVSAVNEYYSPHASYHLSSSKSHLTVSPPR